MTEGKKIRKSEISYRAINILLYLFLIALVIFLFILTIN